MEARIADTEKGLLHGIVDRDDQATVLTATNGHSLK